MIRFSKLLFLFFFCVHADAHLHNFYVDFDISMQREQYSKLFTQEGNRVLYAYFRHLYQRTNFLRVTPKPEAKIPKIIHHIWLGSKLPEAYESWYQSWRKYHPDWKFIFWTDTTQNYDRGKVIHSFDELAACLRDGLEQFLVVDVHRLMFDNKRFFDAADNYGERSDILKWEIVYQFGGVYVDTDFECLKPLDPLHHAFDFYTGLQPLDTHRVQLGAALFAAKPGHDFLKACVGGIAKNQDKKHIVTRTGPLYFTASLISTIRNASGINIILPASYLYPCSYEQRGTKKDLWCKPESFAVHHWEGSWLGEKGCVS